MELSLARELPNCELSTISTAASRSRQREESLPRINTAISRRRVSGEAQSPQGYGCKGREDPNTSPFTLVLGLADSVPTTPLDFGGPAPCELSLAPQTRRERDPSKTRFSARAGSSAVTGSNQRRGAFSPRRRDPRCKKTQPHRPTAQLPLLLAPHLQDPARFSTVQSSSIPQEVHISSFSFGLSGVFSLFLPYPLCLNLCRT